MHGLVIPTQSPAAVAVVLDAIISGIDQQTKKFTEPPDQIKSEIASIKANKSIPEPQKKEDLVQLEAALKDTRPITGAKVL
jgi:hypothetical protein